MTVIFVATVVLGISIDVVNIDTVPCFSSLASLIQHAGRPACDRERHGEAIIYIKKSDIEAATAFIDSDENY
jgi:hypothetical protein